MLENYSLIENYSFKKDIGEGNFGKVKLSIFKPTGEEFAIKILNKEKIKQKMKGVLFKENEIITKFNHINVVYVFQILEDEENYYIIMEYCKKGELFDYIVSCEKLSEEETSNFFYQLINGVEYIHSKGIAHRDLKPENLLLTKDKTLKIIDFGLSHEFNGNNLLKTKCGSPSYAAPEIIKGQLYDGFKTDIWCCGIILYAMICGYLPFEGDNNKLLFKNILECNPEYPKFISKSVKNLIKSILKINPEHRISIEDIKKSDFYLKGKKICKIDYESMEGELIKRSTFYGKKEFSNINIDNKQDEKKQDKNIKNNNVEILRSNSKIRNRLYLITNNNSPVITNTFRQKILNKNLKFTNKIEILSNKIDEILKTETNSLNLTNTKNNQFLEKLSSKNTKNNYNNNNNIFNHRNVINTNNNNDKLNNIFGGLNIYNRAFLMKNDDALSLKQKVKNESNSIGTKKRYVLHYNNNPSKLMVQNIKNYPFLNVLNNNYDYKNTYKYNNYSTEKNSVNSDKNRTIPKRNLNIILNSNDEIDSLNLLQPTISNTKDKFNPSKISKSVEPTIKIFSPAIKTPIKNIGRSINLSTTKRKKNVEIKSTNTDEKSSNGGSIKRVCDTSNLPKHRSKSRDNGHFGKVVINVTDERDINKMDVLPPLNFHLQNH